MLLPYGESEIIVKTCIILNPRAGGGRGEEAGRVLAAQLPQAELLVTQSHGDAVSLARRAREQGTTTLIVVGGDGTIQQAVTGLCLDATGALVEHQTQLAIVPAGTGGDFRRTFSFDNSLVQAMGRILSPRPQKIDLARVTHRYRGQDRTSVFANVLSFGLGGLTDSLVASGPKWLGGRAAYFLGAVRATAVHHPVPIELTLDDKVVEVAAFSNVAVCLGQYFGGGMHVAPLADPSDGYLDVVTMELSKLKTLSLAKDIYRGTHLQREGVKHYRCRKLRAAPTRNDESLLDIDGEQSGKLPIEVELLPHALQLLS